MLARQPKRSAPGGKLMISRVSPPPLRQRLTASSVREPGDHRSVSIA
jgi:hypothetical protein